MLGDQAEKSKNPLKKVIRRRNAKTVAFAAPTYVEASDIDYSTDEEEGDGDFYAQNGQHDQHDDEKEAGTANESTDVVAPLKIQNEGRDGKHDLDEAGAKASSESARTSDEIFENKPESKQSRNGTLRNTDSFFKDDTVETKKITLTPNLLRDDSSTSTRTSVESSKDLKHRPSLDKLEKEPSLDKVKDKKGKEKKEKDKKSGMLSGLFKRKDKKSKVQDEDIDELIMGKRPAEDAEISPVTSKDSEETASEEPISAPIQEVQRPSKLQKQPRTEGSPVRKAGPLEDTRALEPQQTPAPERATPAEAVQQPSMRLVQSDTPEEDEPSLGSSKGLALTPVKEQKSGGTISKILRSASSSTSEVKPVKTKRAKSRVELDDFDSSREASPVAEIEQQPTSRPAARPIPGSFPDSYISYPPAPAERQRYPEDRLSESPVQVSPITNVASHPPPLMVDTSSQEEVPSPVSSPSPELIDADEAREKKGSSTTSASTTTWSDANLRTFFDDDADIKDLLVVVYDKSGVVPAGPDHPITGNLFREENAKLAEITNVSCPFVRSFFGENGGILRLLMILIASRWHVRRLARSKNASFRVTLKDESFNHTMHCSDDQRRTGKMGLFMAYAVTYSTARSRCRSRAGVGISKC